MRQAPDHRVTRNALAPATSTPPVLTSNTARQHCMVCLNVLTRHLQAQVIQARERAQIRAIKDSIGHVEVFQMDGVGTPIIGRPRPIPGHDTPNPANNTYTLNYEEPPIASSSRIDFVNLMDYRGSDQEWKEELLSEPNVYSAEVIKPAGDRGPIWCSADRHAFVLSVFGRDVT